MGLMQLMLCNVTDFKVKDPFDIAENIRGGIEHLAEFLYKYQGKSNYEQTVLALACYNAGPGAVARYGGVPPYNETQSYVRKVPALFAQLVKDGYP
jgi:soluble lytic murein transglycosylase-like protein